MDCPHSDVTFAEVAHVELSFRVTDGVMVGDYASEASPTAPVWVTCHVCGGNWRYPSKDRLPIWARALYEKIPGRE